MREIILQLFDIGAIKFGTFTLKSGIVSPIYIDLRESISFPRLLKAIAESMWKMASHKHFDTICGVPYTALPMASYLSVAYDRPMVMRRKEVKEHGTRKMIEGVFKPNQVCLVFEDLITSGASILETIAPLEAAGMKVNDAIVFLDREQGGRQALELKGYRVHAVITLSEMLDVLLENNRIDHKTKDAVTAFSRGRHMSKNASKTTAQLTYAERANCTVHPLAKRLLSLMDKKKSNLALAADVTSAKELLDLANTLGPDLCILKTHIDIIGDFDAQLPAKLRAAADKHQFLLFEDRKFADIGNTVLQQYQGGVYRISDWAHITNAHPLPGPGIIEGLKKVGLPKGNALLLLAQLSSAGSLIDRAYTEATVEMALRYPDFVIGFICQERLTEEPSLIHMTPGVQLASKGDALGQQYNTPHHAIVEKESDIAIVGRGVFQHSNPKQAAAEYREAAWDAYQQRLA